MREFAPSPIAGLVDETPLYDLAESTCQDISVAELLGPGGSDRVAKQALGYATSTGDEELRRLLAANLEVSADRVLVTSGASAALFLVGLLTVDDGEAVVATPCFPPTVDALRGLGAPVVTAELAFDDGFRLDLGAVERALSSRTRLVVVASPQNPSGVRFTPAEVGDLLDLMARTCPEALLLVDETFREATYGEEAPARSFAGLSPRVLTCGSVSKAHGAPGLRIGWLTVPTDELYEQLRLAKFNSALTCGRLDEMLAAELLGRSTEVLTSRRRFLAAARAVVADFVDAHADRVEWVRPDAGAFCCLRLRPGVDVDRFHAALAARRVAVARGEWFGERPSAFRLGFGHEPMDRLRAGLAQLGEALGR